MLVLISRDEVLALRLQQVAAAHQRELQVVDRREALARCGRDEPLEHVFIDLNVGDDALEFISEMRAGPCNPVIVAFLDHFVGDLPIRAKLAGANRIVPREQLERELPKILDA
jgi:hypothetical protein